MILLLILAIFVSLPTALYILINQQILKIVLAPNSKKALNAIYEKITYSVFIFGALLTFLICCPIIQQYWGILNALPIIISYLVLASLIQAILFIILAPDQIHRPTKAVLPITIMANGIGIVVILIAMPLLLGAVGMLYRFFY